MKVFISWSGDLSREIGEAFRNWLPDVLQFVDPFFTPEDVMKGKRWGSEIASHLSASKIGLFCLTAQNLNAPWLIFEAGAISNLNEAHLCPMLFGVDNSQLKGPLAQFQATPYSKEELLKFITAINTAAGSSGLSASKLHSAFDKWWPELDEKIRKLLDKPAVDSTPAPRLVNDMVEEVLGIVRTLSSSSAPLPELTHWSLMLSMLLDHAEEILAATHQSDQLVVLEILKAEIKFLRGSLNLLTPRLMRASNWHDVHFRAKDLMDRLEKRQIELDDDIPF